MLFIKCVFICCGIGCAICEAIIGDGDIVVGYGGIIVECGGTIGVAVIFVVCIEAFTVDGCPFVMRGPPDAAITPCLSVQFFL